VKFYTGCGKEKTFKMVNHATLTRTLELIAAEMVAYEHASNK